MNSEGVITREDFIIGATLPVEYHGIKRTAEVFESVARDTTGAIIDSRIALRVRIPEQDDDGYEAYSECTMSFNADSTWQGYSGIIIESI